ncbi:MAG: MFS transporter [Acidimicrobiales bacterium]|nr:MFS transporter [Acidimicrobiales bacterium]
MDDDQLAGRVERIYLNLGFVFGFVMMCFAVAATVAWVTEAGLSPTRLIIMGSVLEATALLFEVPTGVVADRHSRKWSTVIGYVLVGLGVLTSLSTTYWILLVGQFIWGLGFTFQSGAVTAWATDQLGRDIDELIVEQARRRSLGFVVGIVVGTAIGSINLFWAIGLAGLVAIGTAALLAFVMPEPVKPAGADQPESALQTARNGWNVVRPYPMVRLVMLVALLGGAGSEVLDRLYTKRLIDIGVPFADPVVIIGALLLFAQLGSWWVLGRVVNRLGGREIGAGAIGAAYATTALASFALALGPVFAIAAAGQFVSRISRATIEPIESVVVNRRARSQERATILSFHGQADALGQALGGPTMALVAWVSTTSTAMAAGASLYAVAAAIALTRKTGKGDDPAAASG